jgi:hypothetical protein
MTERIGERTGDNLLRGGEYVPRVGVRAIREPPKEEVRAGLAVW